MIPKLSVCVITYNHENYIAQALDSALIQKGDFLYEIVIGEDCSTDSTLKICTKYAQQYPDKIRLFHRETNLGMMNNFIATLNACEGEYIALLEGDDYWTADDKLTRQIEFLDQYKDYSICSHNVNIANGDQISKEEWLGKDAQAERTLDDVIKRGGAATGSLVFRKDAFLPAPDWYAKQKGGDWSLQVLCASKGNMKYFSDIMGVYRRHARGAIYYQELEARNRCDDVTGLSARNSLEICNALDEYFDFRYSKLFDHQRFYWYLVGAGEYSSVNTWKAFQYLWMAFRRISFWELSKNTMFIDAFRRILFRRWVFK